MVTTTTPTAQTVQNPKCDVVQSLWRYCWYFGLLVVATIATVVQIDRHALELPALAKWVPSQFRSFALIREAADEAVRGDPRRAVGDARRLVAKHPIPAEPLTILAIAEHRAGDGVASSAALILAAQRGWREPLAQQSVAIAAMQTGQAEIAADRLSALWKTMKGRPHARELSGQLLEERAVRKKFASKLANRKEWVEAFLSWASRNLALPIFADIIEEANKKGATFDCAMIARTARAFLEQGALLPAQQLWASQCGNKIPSGESDFAFSGVKSTNRISYAPFSWIFPSSVGLTVTSSVANDLASIDFENKDPIRRLIAKKYMALPPGRHSIRVEADELGASSRSLLIRFKCQRQKIKNETEPRAKTHSVTDGPLLVDVPNEGCRVQTLGLIVGKGSGKNIRAIID